MSLTTPVPRHLDSAFPGENWFFYWKTSASLWKTKLSEFPGTRIVVPLYWSFHSETGDHFDFGENRPETDLKKLIEIAKESGKEVVFFLQVTPFPFLPNGGIPHLLARTLSLNSHQMAYGLIDGEDNLIKLYTFFDTRVFEAFDRFLIRLGQYFSEHRISSDVWAIRSGYFVDGFFKSFFDDHSKIFDQAFARFLQNKLTEEQKLSAIEEQQYRFEYVKSIQDLYISHAKAALDINFEGVLNVAFIGSSEESFLKRLYGNITTADYTYEIFQSLTKDIIPASVLIKGKEKLGVLGRELNDLVANSYLPARLQNSAYEEDVAIFRPLSFFKVYEKVDGLSSMFQSFEDLKLWDYLKEHFGWSYKIISNDTLNLHESKGPYEEHILLFHGHDVDRNIFNYILKTFLNGGRVILNKSGLSDEYNKRLETFFLENSLQVEKVNFKTSIQNIQLGEGRLLLFEGDGLQGVEAKDLNEFWIKIIDTFSLLNIKIQNSDGVDFYWRTRSSTTNELRFEEVRRLSLYNPTSYRKKMRIQLNKNFVIYKVIDEINVLVQTFPNEVDIEISPDGSVVLDFGVFS